MYSNDDEVVYPQQSQELSWDLTANGVPHQLVMVNRGGHEFANAGESPNEANIAQDVVDFFTHTLVQHRLVAG